MTGWNDKRNIIDRYDATADMYNERYAEEQKRKYAKALEKVNVAGKAILDVGCGSGLLFKEIAAKSELVVGVDISLRLLKKAKEQAQPFDNVFLLQADADHLPFKDGFFGCVFAFTVLQNMPIPAQTLCELKRAVENGGRITVTGLKKAFSLEMFMDILEGTGMKLAAVMDDEAVNCYIAVLTT